MNNSSKAIFEDQPVVVVKMMLAVVVRKGNSPGGWPFEMQEEFEDNTRHFVRSFLIEPFTSPVLCSLTNSELAQRFMIIWKVKDAKWLLSGRSTAITVTAVDEFELRSR
jgi:hypothetical protein